jgi:uncharacterized phiE125 gp8 family phage protein
LGLTAKSGEAMGLKLITPPATTPVSLDEAKVHLRVVDDDEDLLIGTYIQAATGSTEAFLGRALIDQTWDLVLDAFPTTTDLEIKIPKPPLIEVTQIAYDDSNGDEQILPSGNYFVDAVSEFGWVVPQGNLSWPSTIDAINSVRVRFRAGYLDTNSPPGNAVPDDIRAAVLLTIGSFYEQRESLVVGTVVYQLPWGVEQLLRQHRVLLGMA